MGGWSGYRKSPKPENYSKMPQNPTRRVHALLGSFLPTQTFAIIKYQNIIQNAEIIYACFVGQFFSIHQFLKNLAKI